MMNFEFLEEQQSVQKMVQKFIAIVCAELERGDTAYRTAVLCSYESLY